jgi:hypothetical protein
MKKYLMFIFVFIIFFQVGLLNAKSFNLSSQEETSDNQRIISIRKFKLTMLTLSPERVATLVHLEKDGDYTVENIVHDKRLWKAHIRTTDIISSWVYNSKLPFGLFHFSAGFEFQEPVLLEPMDGNLSDRFETKILVMGSGPTITMSVGAILGTQSITIRTYTIENFSSEVKDIGKITSKIDPEKINLKKFFLAFAEEANRTYFLQQLRISLLDSRKNIFRRDPLGESRYNILVENCISSGIRNLSTALKPEFYNFVLTNNILKKDISSFDNVLTEEELKKRIKLFRQGAIELDEWLSQRLEHKEDLILFDTPIDLMKSSKIIKDNYDLAKSYLKEAGGRDNQLALPWRSKGYIKFVTEKSNEENK